jgi:hypothetical protein
MPENEAAELVASTWITKIDSLETEIRDLIARCKELSLSDTIIEQLTALKKGELEIWEQALDGIWHLLSDTMIGPSENRPI